MTGRELDADFDPDRVFAGLRNAVRAATWVPAPAAVRARAERRRRNRRAAAALAAAAAVVVVVLAGANLTRIDAAPTPPPAGTESAEPTPNPSAALPPPRPSLSVPVRPVETPDDPITTVDWANATITVPAREGCPAGRLRFQDGSTDGYPKMTLSTDEFGAPVAYGDLVGAQRPEAVIEAYCELDVEGDHWPANLLVIERRAGGDLRGVAWVGPAGWGIYGPTWISDLTLYTEQQQSGDGYEYSPGAAAAYRWNGSAFARVDSGLYGLQPLADPKPAVHLGADTDYVPRALSCPGGTVMFEPPASYQPTYRGYLYSIQTYLSDHHVADLDGDGYHHVLVTVLCHPLSVSPDEAYRSSTGHGILVLDRTANGFRAVDVVTLPSGFTGMGGWHVADGRLTVSAARGDGTGEDVAFVWNGRYFQR